MLQEAFSFVALNISALYKYSYELLILVFTFVQVKGLSSKESTQKSQTELPEKIVSSPQRVKQLLKEKHQRRRH